METRREFPKLYGTIAAQQDRNLLKPIVICRSIGFPLTSKQKANLAHLTEKYGELQIQRAEFDGLQRMRATCYQPDIRETHDSYYEESDETLVFTPPSERVEKLPNTSTTISARQTPELSILQVSARHKAEGIVAYGSSCSISRSLPKVEKPSAVERPHWPTLDELVSKAKALEPAPHLIE